MMHTFKINAPLNVEDTFIEMDGKRIDGVTKVTFELNGDIPGVTLYLEIVGRLVVDGEFREGDIVRVVRKDAA